jgi:hypothetical protein
MRRAHIRDGSIFDWLGPQLGNLWEFTGVLSVLDWGELLDFFQGLADTVDANRKFGSRTTVWR